MDLKKMITESVLEESITMINEELTDLKKFLEEQMIIEGVDDPGILKMIFMAGGPGSGKGYTSMELFGIDKTFKSSFAATGLKVVNSDTAYEAGLKKNGIDSKKLADIEKENPELWDAISGNSPNSIRNKAKGITKKQKAFYEAGRLGMIIDGTGHNFGKIKKMKDAAEAMGYDTYMLFVNTTLKVAHERNKNRERVLPDEIVSTLWKDVQQNLGAFKNLFGGNFEIVDNTVYKPLAPNVKKSTARFVRNPIKNPIGKEWITTARALKNANLIKK